MCNQRFYGDYIKSKSPASYMHVIRERETQRSTNVLATGNCILDPSELGGGGGPPLPILRMEISVKISLPWLLSLTKTLRKLIGLQVFAPSPDLSI